jgi:predicted permease
LLDDLRQDLRHGLRSLRRNPGFTSLVVLTLALGIGANAAVFSLVDLILLRTLPVREPDRLVLFSDGLEDGHTDGGWGRGRVRAYSYSLFDRLRRDAQGGGQGDGLFEDVAAQQTTRTRSVVRRMGVPDRDPRPDPGVPANGRLASGNFFQVLGVSAWRGRTLLPEDEGARGANPVVVLSHAYWQRRFGSAPDLLGSALSINGRRYTVVGILPPELPGTRVGDPTDLWLPLSMQAEFMRGDPLYERSDRWLLVYGRLKPSVTLAVAEASVNVSLQRWLSDRPVPIEDNVRRTSHIQLQPGHAGTSGVREDARRPLLVLWAAVAVLLIIVGLNVSHLLLARSVTRQRELAIRTALGGSRGRLLRQSLAESALLATLGAGGGVVAARLMIDGLLAFTPGIIPDVQLDLRALLLVAALAAGTAALLGVVPAVHAARIDIQQSLRASSQAITGPGTRRLWSRLLLASQVACSLVLLVGAGLLASSLSRLREQDMGFERQHILHAQMLLRETGLSRDEALRVYDQLVERAGALSGVQSASMSLGTGNLLRAATWRSDLHFTDGRPSRDALAGTVTPGYFATMGIGLVRGRAFTAEDNAGAPPVAVVNETLARQVFGSASAALGQRLSFDEDEPRDIQIVGVVRDARTLQVRREPSRAIYRPVAQAFDYLWSLEVRAHGDPALLADLVRQTVRDTHPALGMPNVKTLSEHVEASLRHDLLLATLSTGFGVIALFLVCLGLYGVIGQWVGQRTREIGVRMALGATAPGLRWLVLRQAFVLVAAGMLVGLPAALAAAQLLKGLLYGVPAVHAPTLVLVALALFAVATAAAYLPARRASRVNPMQALRAE